MINNNEFTITGRELYATETPCKLSPMEKAIERHVRKLWHTGEPTKAINGLARAVRAEVEPTLARLREVDAMVNSGMSLLAFLHKREAAIPQWTRIWEDRPALPQGLKMPPNKCTSPAFNV